MKRLFFALWPDSDTRRQCHRIAQSLRGVGKPVADNNLHVTLLFLGGVDAGRQAALMQAVAVVSVQPMHLRFERLSYWRKPAVVCLCARQTDLAVSRLVERLMEIATQQQIAFDSRPYKPHVTLLRKAKALPEFQFEPVDWYARSFCLVESVSTPNGVEYRVLERWGER